MDRCDFHETSLDNSMVLHLYGANICNSYSKYLDILRSIFDSLSEELTVKIDLPPFWKGIYSCWEQILSF